MENRTLWNLFQDLKSTCRWVDLTHDLSPDTPHWVGWDALRVEEKMSLNEAIFAAHAYTTVGQYGTHVDAPSHMVKGGRSLDEIALEEMILPLCVINLEDKVKENPDYVLTVDDILSWEAIHGKIPAGSFVAFQSGWSRFPGDLDNCDADGCRHFPGWSSGCVPVSWSKIETSPPSAMKPLIQKRPSLLPLRIMRSNTTSWLRTGFRQNF